jgi:hypothetical protein
MKVVILVIFTLFTFRELILFSILWHNSGTACLTADIKKGMCVQFFPREELVSFYSVLATEED